MGVYFGGLVHSLHLVLGCGRTEQSSPVHVSLASMPWPTQTAPLAASRNEFGETLPWLESLNVVVHYDTCSALRQCISADTMQK